MSTEMVQRDTDPFELGKVFAESGMFPNTRKAAEAIVKIVAGREFGLGPMAAMQGIHMVDGRPTLAANLIAGQIKRHPNYNYKVIRREADGCELEFHERDDKGLMQVSGTMTFEKKDAQAANLLGKQNWKKYPRDMYFARCLTAGARTYCPDVLGGSPVYTAEEFDADEVGPPDPVVEQAVAEVKDNAPEPEIADAVVVQDPPAEAAPSPVDAMARAAVTEETLKQISAAAKKRWPDRATMRDQLKWQLIGLESIEFDANDDDPALLLKVMESLTAAQAFELLKRLEEGGES